MPTECIAEQFDFGTVEGRAVEAAYDDDEKLVAAYPATVGSDDTPSPEGKHKGGRHRPRADLHLRPEETRLRGGQSQEKHWFGWGSARSRLGFFTAARANWMTFAIGIVAITDRVRRESRWRNNGRPDHSGSERPSG